MAVYNLSVAMTGAAVLTATVTTSEQGINILPSVAQIISDFNLNTTQNGTLMSELTAMWGSYRRYEDVADGLQDLYCRRQVCLNLLGNTWPIVDYVQAGTDDNAGEQFTHLQTLYTNYSNEISRIENRAAQSYSPTSGCMDASPPVAIRPGQIGQTYPGGPYGPWRRFGPFGRL